MCALMFRSRQMIMCFILRSFFPIKSQNRSMWVVSSTFPCSDQSYSKLSDKWSSFTDNNSNRCSSNIDRQNLCCSYRIIMIQWLMLPSEEEKINRMMNFTPVWTRTRQSQININDADHELIIPWANGKFSCLWSLEELYICM